LPPASPRSPGLSLHLLANGRRFADPEFTRRYAAVGLSDLMAGIPIYAPEPGLHDFIVQAAGAFNETVHGILNLASLGQAVEIRVVIQRHTVPVPRRPGCIHRADLRVSTGHPVTAHPHHTVGQRCRPAGPGQARHPGCQPGSKRSRPTNLRTQTIAGLPRRSRQDSAI
jgi:hypothetical protein